MQPLLGKSIIKYMPHEQTPEREQSRKRLTGLWQKGWFRGGAKVAMIGSASLATLTVGGDYFAHRFGSEAGQSAFDTFSNDESPQLNHLENSVPKEMGERIGNAAICQFAEVLHFTPKELAQRHIVCPELTNSSNPGPATPQAAQH